MAQPPAAESHSVSLDLASQLRANPMLPRDAMPLASEALDVDDPSPQKASEHLLGSSASFWVADIDQKRFRVITATLQAMPPHIEMWVEEGLELDRSALARSAQVFEERIYPTNLAHLGQEWSPGIDGQTALVALHARMTGSLGYFSAANELSRSENPYSNEREMFVLDGVALQPGTLEYEGVLAHEHQHMIHWRQDRNEDAWVNEGASELAEDLSGYDWPHNKVAAFAENSDLQLNDWGGGASETSRHYGASYLFLRYLLERFGPETLKAIIAQQSNGMEGVEAALREQDTRDSVDQVYADWVVANWVDRPDLDPRYGYTRLDINPQPELSIAGYPTHYQGEVAQYGADYIATPRPGDSATGAGDSATGASLRIRFQGEPIVKLTPNDAASGAYQWWSNRGDSSYAYLERSVDLTHVSGAMLHYDLWYEIETGWDYGHLRGSADGGRTWHWLRGDLMTDHNPVGNARGPGYTGRSGIPLDQVEGSEARWVRERVDLSGYAGSRVTLRFEYVTDDAINWHGLCLDNLRIEGADWADDVERGGDGWISQGFIRHDNRLAQRYAVQWIVLGESVSVQRLAVNPDGVGEWQVPWPDQGGQATLAISALAPATTQRASYSLWLEEVSQAARQ